jgi:chemotaxis receptor (MCP) glutamine deamidase CheD
MHVGVGEFGVSNEKGGFLKTFALSSCVAVIMVAYTKHTAGLLHVALPESGMDLELAKERPGYFADTGIPALLREMERHGCRRSELVVKLVGGAGTIQPGLKSKMEAEPAGGDGPTVLGAQANSLSICSGLGLVQQMMSKEES